MRRGIAVLATVALLACSTSINPASGRREVILMSQEDEQRIDAEIAREIEASLGVAQDARLQRYVERVGAQMAAHSPRQDVEYHFQVVEMDEPNAFALPGGHIYVSRGLILLANTEAELAHVLGHEIGHVAARHAAQQDAHMKTLGLATALSNLLSGGAEEQPQAERVSGNFGARYARNQEREADRIGRDLAEAAGIDPAGMARFLVALDSYSKLNQGFSMPQTYFGTHPATLERIAEASTQAEALSWRAEDPTAGPFIAQTSGREAYLHEIDGMVVGRPASEGVFVEDRFLHADLRFALRFPHGWELRNEAAQVVGVSPQRDGVVLLQLQGPGSDPVAAAREYAEEQGLALERAAQIHIGDNAALRASALVPTRFGRINAEITWIAYDGRIYRLIGGMQPGKLRKYQGTFRKFAQSFRPLRGDDLALISELRLRSVEAAAGETLAELGTRSGNRWDLAYTAVANGLFVDARLAEGQRIKIAVSEPYVPEPPREPTPEPAGPAPTDDDPSD